QGSELEKLCGGLSDGLPVVDMAEQARTLGAVRAAARSGLVQTAHDVAEGGLAVAVAECAIGGRIGARVRVARDDASAFFGEAPGAVLVTVDADAFEELAALCGDVPVEAIGVTGGDAVVLEGPVARLSVQVTDAVAVYEEA